MATISGMLRRIESINLLAVCSDSVDATKDAFLEENRHQMYDGKLKTGADITPSYLDDPYFKTKEAAQAYSDWKDRITPNQNRKKGTPNLFINGAYYSTLSIFVAAGSISMSSSFPEASSIESKFGKDIYGLGGPFKIHYISNNLYPYWIGQIQQKMRA